MVQKLTVWFNFKKAYKVKYLLRLLFFPLRCGKSEVWNQAQKKKKSNSTSRRNQRKADRSVGKRNLEITSKVKCKYLPILKKHTITLFFPLAPLCIDFKPEKNRKHPCEPRRRQVCHLSFHLRVNWQDNYMTEAKDGNRQSGAHACL